MHIPNTSFPVSINFRTESDNWQQFLFARRLYANETEWAAQTFGTPVPSVRARLVRRFRVWRSEFPNEIDAFVRERLEMAEEEAERATLERFLAANR